MNIDIDLNKIEHEDLLLLYNKVTTAISYFEDEATNSEVEKSEKK